MHRLSPLAAICHQERLDINHTGSRAGGGGQPAGKHSCRLPRHAAKGRRQHRSVRLRPVCSLAWRAGNSTREQAGSPASMTDPHLGCKQRAGAWRDCVQQEGLLRICVMRQQQLHRARVPLQTRRTSSAATRVTSLEQCPQSCFQRCKTASSARATIPRCSTHLTFHTAICNACAATV